MTEKDLNVPREYCERLTSADFERVLARLIVMAEGEGRDFLAYLLTMALIHLREEAEGRTSAPH